MWRKLFLLVACVTVGSAIHTVRKGSNDASAEFEECKQFLSDNMPASDSSLNDDFLDSNIRLALEAREAHSWASDIPFDMFLNNVLPYANLDENRDDWRELFFTEFSPIVKDASTRLEALKLLNENIWSKWNISFKADQAADIRSPQQVMDHGFASCTGLSIFFVDALRSVGIPARITGTAKWNNAEGGNHNWVEAYLDDNTWSFTEAQVHDKMNVTWFMPNPTSMAATGYDHGIFAVSFKPTSTHFPLSWDADSTAISAVERTTDYVNIAEHKIATVNCPHC